MEILFFKNIFYPKIYAIQRQVVKPKINDPTAFLKDGLYWYPR
jgi:hypothetical protein